MIESKHWSTLLNKLCFRKLLPIVSLTLLVKDTASFLRGIDQNGYGYCMKRMQKSAVPMPGSILQRKFLIKNKLSQNQLALKIRVPARRINEIVLGKRAISADTALRLGLFFDNDPSFWLSIQADYDLWRIKKEKGSEIEADVQPLK